MAKINSSEIQIFDQQICPWGHLNLGESNADTQICAVDKEQLVLSRKPKTVEANLALVIKSLLYNCTLVESKLPQQERTSLFS